MLVLKHKGKVFGAKFTAAEQKAIDIEVNKHVLEVDKEYQIQLFIEVLYTLYASEGYGKKRLHRFLSALMKEHDNLVNRYQMPDDFDWLAEKKLKDAGVDVRQWVDDLKNDRFNMEDYPDE